MWYQWPYQQQNTCPNCGSCPTCGRRTLPFSPGFTPRYGNSVGRTATNANMGINYSPNTATEEVK